MLSIRRWVTTADQLPDGRPFAWPLISQNPVPPRAVRPFLHPNKFLDGGRSWDQKAMCFSLPSKHAGRTICSNHNLGGCLLAASEFLIHLVIFGCRI